MGTYEDQGPDLSEPRARAWNDTASWFMKLVTKCCPEHPEQVRNVQREPHLETADTLFVHVYAIDEARAVFTEEFCAALSQVLSAVTGIPSTVELCEAS